MQNCRNTEYGTWNTEETHLSSIPVIYHFMPFRFSYHLISAQGFFKSEIIVGPTSPYDPAIRRLGDYYVGISRPLSTRTPPSLNTLCRETIRGGITRSFQDEETQYIVHHKIASGMLVHC